MKWLLEDGKKPGDIIITEDNAFLKMPKKGKRNARFFKELIIKLNSGCISEDDIEKSIYDVDYNCQCEPCDNKDGCFYSTVT